MTLEEAKKLKPGDVVLVEARIVKGVRASENSVHIDDIPNGIVWVLPQHIREKITPRRKFRKGDIVLDSMNDIAIVAKDEESGKNIILRDCEEGGMASEWEEPSDVLSLVCSVEERADRKEGKA